MTQALPQATGYITPTYLKTSPSYQPSRLLPQRDLSEYGTKGKRLGAGAYGEVRAYNGNYAIKTIRMKMDDGVRKDFLREAANLLRTNHPYIVPLYDIVREEKRKEILYHLVLPLAVSDLRRPVRANSLTEEEKKRSVYQTICALAYLHTNDIVHRDVKPDNILYYGDGNIQLSDFGLSLAVGCPFPTGLTNAVYTLPYRAPELALEEEYTSAADVWALGCTVYEIYNEGIHPFRPVVDDNSLLRKISFVLSSGEIETNLKAKGVDKEIIGIILECFEADPGKRITADLLLNDKVFDSVRVRENESFPFTCDISLSRREAYPLLEIPLYGERIVFTWLYEVMEDRRLPLRSYYHAIWLYDALSSLLGGIEEKERQIFGAVALSVAAKYAGNHELNPAQIKVFSDDMYSEEEIIEAERRLLEQINFDLAHTLAYDYLLLYMEEEDINQWIAETLLIFVSLHPLRFKLMPREIGRLAANLAQLVTGKITLRRMRELTEKKDQILPFLIDSIKAPLPQGIEVETARPILESLILILEEKED